MRRFLTNLTGQQIIGIFVVFGVFVYVNSFTNPFFADDISLIVKNPSITNISNLSIHFFQGNFTDSNRGSRNNYYRPLLSSAFSIIYFFSLGGNPVGFHIAQLLLHILNVVLLFHIFSYFFKKDVSLFLSFVFLLHPFNTEAVIYISALQEPLFVSFGLLALLLALKSDKHSSLWITVLLTASLLSKETGIAFVFIIPLFVTLFDKQRFVNITTQSLSAVVIYLVLRFGVAHIYFQQNPIVPIMTLSFWERVIHIPKIIFFYLKTFFYPKDLLFAQSWTIRALTMNDFFLPLILDLLFFFVLIIFSVYIYSKNSELFKGIKFFIVWFILGVGIHLQIIPLDQTVADRWFYFPMIGLLGLVGIAVTYFYSKIKESRRIIFPVVLVMLIVFAGRIMIRNSNWKDGVTLISHDIQVNQDSHQLESGLAYEYMNKGNVDEAEKHYQHAIALFPHFNTYFRLGHLYALNDRFPQAQEAFETALRYDSKNPSAWVYLAYVKYRLGDREGALFAATKAYTISPTSVNLSLLQTIRNGKELRIFAR